MSRQCIELTLTLHIEAPYLVHGTDPGRFGLDATQFVDHRGRPVLPGTLVAGRIAEAWEAHEAQLGQAKRATWFGRPGVSDPSGDLRARLRVQDLVLDPVGPPTTGDPVTPLDATRIMEDSATGAVKSAHLLIIEQLHRPGTRLCFRGVWQVWAEPEEATVLCRQIHAGLLLQTQLGAYRSVGFGRVLGAEVRQAPATRLSMPPAAPSTAERQRWALWSTDALCVGARSRRGNVFESSTELSGSTLKAALARTLLNRHGGASVAHLSDRSLLARHFDALRITHALPARHDGARPLPLPQSLVGIGDDIADAWRCRQPALADGTAPAFATDWKASRHQRADAARQAGPLGTHLRVRTAIEHGKAKDEQLFAMKCVVAPLNAAGEPLTRWLFDIDLGHLGADGQPAIPPADRPGLWAELSDLLAHGLAPLGKTDALAHAAPLRADDRGQDTAWPAATTPLAAGDLVPVLLVTDAVLFPTNDVADQPRVDLPALYARSFEGLADAAGLSGALVFSHAFATQRLAGGGFLRSRYHEVSKRHYQPLVLTEAGSVFVLRVVQPERAQRLLDTWARHGLPVPPHVAQAHGATWRDHPYLPENGHGEVAIRPTHGLPELAPTTHA